MKLFRKPGFLAFFIGVLLVFPAGYLFLALIASKTLRCHECACRYELNSENPFCRFPAILELWFIAAVAGIIASFAAAWFLHRRARRMK